MIPGAAGTLPFRRRATETRLSLPFVVTGRVDVDGNENADPFAGLEVNLAFLYAYVILPTNTGDGTRELVWHRPSGSSTTGDVHVIGYRPGLKAGGIAVGTLELSDTRGVFHL